MGHRSARAVLSDTTHPQQPKSTLASEPFPCGDVVVFLNNCLNDNCDVTVSVNTMCELSLDLVEVC